jgi:uncharacterized membrane protein affecting hemolysin expression
MHYSFTTHKENDKIIVGEIAEKGGIQGMLCVGEDISIVKIFDQRFGNTMQFLSTNKDNLVNFQDGLKLGVKIQSGELL